MSAFSSTWRSIWRFHTLLAGILVLEYALTFAIVLVTLGVLMIRAQALNETSGVDEGGLYVLYGEGIGEPVHRAELFEAKSRFQALVGDNHVALGSSVPFWGLGSSEVPVSVPDDPHHSAPIQVNVYEGDRGFAQVIGLHILQGRGFQSNEIVQSFGDVSHMAILSVSLAQRLFHGQMAVGRQIEIAGKMHTVVGVMNPLAAPQYLGASQTTSTLLLPKLPGSGSLVLIRYYGAVDNLKRVLNMLRKYDEGKVNWSLVSYASVRSGYFRSDRLTVAALAAIVCLVLVTALCGILGLTSYWISRRRRQIAIRRALGATRQDIFRHFIGESAVLAIMGLSFGPILYFLSGSFIGNFQVNFGIVTWLLSTVLILLLVMLVVFVSLRRWLRMDPAELMRSI